MSDILFFEEKRIGIDLHGTLDSNVDFFKEIINMLLEEGWEVYIITGMEKDKALKEIESYGLVYTNIISVTDYNKGLGTKITYDEDGNPWIEEKLWNRTKADLCWRMGIYIHVDDSENYGEFFNEGTLYFQYIPGTPSENYLRNMVKLIINIFKSKEKMLKSRIKKDR